MTQDEIIEMGYEAGLCDEEGRDDNSIIITDHLKAFAKLVAAKATDEANERSNTSWTLMCKKMVEDEREACAKVCDGYSDGRHANMADLCAEAIRARS